MNRIRAKLTFANAMSTGAMFLVVTGGTAAALSGRNSVFSDDIVDGQVRSADVRAYALTGRDIGRGQIGTWHVQDEGLFTEGLRAQDLGGGSVGSSEIQAYSIHANHLQDRSIYAHHLHDSALRGLDAASINGIQEREIIINLAAPDAGASDFTAFTHAGISVTLRCSKSEGGVIQSLVDVDPVGPAHGEGVLESTSEVGTVAKMVFRRADDQAQNQAVVTNEAASGQLAYLAAGGATVTFDFGVTSAANSFGANGDCFLYGHLRAS